MIQKEEWREYELGKLLSYEQPTPYIVDSTDYNEKYKTPVLTAGKTFIIGYTNEQNGIYDALPVTIFDDFTTATQYVNFKFKVKSSAMKILTANSELVLPKFIYYRMQIINFDHSTHKRYWIQQYSKQKIARPLLAEQERIVSKIEELFSSLDASVAELQTAKERLKVYRYTVFENAYSKVLDKDYTTLGEVLDGTPQNGIYKSASEYGAGTPILRIDGFYSGAILPDYEFKRLKLTEDELMKYSLNIQDLVINRVNSMPYLGKCALIRSLKETTVFESNMMRMKLDTDKVIPEFITQYLCSIRGKRELTKNAKQAVNQASINQTDVKNARVPVPKKNMQKEILTIISAQLSVCDNIEKTVDEALQQAEAMRQSILKKAFEGRLV